MNQAMEAVMSAHLIDQMDSMIAGYIGNKPGREFLYKLASRHNQDREFERFILGRRPIRGMAKRHDKNVVIAAAFGMLVDDLKPQKGMSKKELKDIADLKRLRNEGLI